MEPTRSPVLRRHRHRRCALGIAACASFAALLPGCAEPPSTNVLLLVVDTLRADHVGSYGYARSTSPSVDRLAAEGVRFERAYATAPWTKPSVASMFSGLHPATHTATGILELVPPEVETLAEILAARGYATAAVVSHVVLAAAGGFDQGFERFLESEARGHDHVSTPGVTRQALALLEELAGGERPFLLFVHLFDPHYAYRDHPEVGFARPTGRLEGGEDIWALREMDDLSEGEVGFLRDLYDEEIRLTDDGIGRILAALGELGIADETLVVLTADHGEELLERGWLGHTVTLHEELLRVPLVVRDPRAACAGRVVEEPVSLVSLTPTLLELLGLPSSDAFQGASFAAAVRCAGPPEAGPVFAEVRYLPRGMDRPVKRARAKAIVEGDYKLILDQEAGAVRLYDLARDPGEKQDLAAVQPERTERLRAQLKAQARQAREAALPARLWQPEPSELDRLRSLGYVR